MTKQFTILALLVAADPYRPAAVEQLVALGKGLDLPVYRAETGTPVLEIVRQGIAQAKKTGRDVVLLDTAGRLTIDETLPSWGGRLVIAVRT